jgi:hypothetical protein
LGLQTGVTTANRKNGFQIITWQLTKVEEMIGLSNHPIAAIILSGNGCEQ